MHTALRNEPDEHSSLIPTYTSRSSTNDRIRHYSAVSDDKAHHDTTTTTISTSPPSSIFSLPSTTNDEYDHTTPLHELRTLLLYSRSLILSFLLQYSLSITSVLTVSRLGTLELGAVSLANVMANITGWAIYQGLATSLDTLCPQAFGSGRPLQVGINVQRMVYFLWTVTIPVAALWLSSPLLLSRIVPDQEVAVLAGQYLQLLVLGAPGYAAFEAGKRFLTSQGEFLGVLWMLIVAAVINVALNWWMVWCLNWGFTGSPLALSITLTLLPIFLALYVTLIRKGCRQCWPGFCKSALKNWKPMIQLAFSGLLMVEAELFAFEILTLLASYISTTHLAASSIISNIVLVLWLLPYSMSMGTGTRVALLIGEMKPNAAKVTVKVSTGLALAVGMLSAGLLVTLRSIVAKIFTNDPEVILLVTSTLPICAAYQPFDAVASNFHGILRGLGRQKIGGLVGLLGWYLLGLPVAVGTVIGSGWGLRGLWFGVALALAFVAVVEGMAVWWTRWKRVVERAKRRNLMA